MEKCPTSVLWVQSDRGEGARAIPARLEVPRHFLPRLVASAARELAKLGAIAVVADVDPVVTYVEVAYSSAPSWTDSLEEAVMKIDGGCHCGAITYEAEIDPETVTICHCTDCQTLSGSAFRTAVPARKDVFRLLTGQAEDLREDGGERQQARPGLLRRVRLADLFVGRERSAGIYDPSRDDPAACRTSAEVADLVSVRTWLVESRRIDEAVRAAAACVAALLAKVSDRPSAAVHAPPASRRAKLIASILVAPLIGEIRMFLLVFSPAVAR